MEVPTILAASRHPGLEALSDAFYMVDAGWRVAYWNAAAERLFGIPREEALARQAWEVLPGTDEGALRSRLGPAMYAGQGVRYLDTLTGELIPRPVWVQASPAENGGVAVHLRDASEERTLAERYSHLLESIRDGFVAVDSDWRIVYVNHQAEALLTLRRRRALGALLWDLLPPEPAAIGETLRATLADGEPRRLEAVRPEGKPFGGRYFDVWAYPLAGGGLSILFDDVTGSLERERELARLAAEAEEASRAKSRFFAAVSHELRTPLNAIVGYTHLLSTDTYGDLPGDATRAAERASMCAEHLARLIDDVLLLTTIEIARLPVSPAPVALPEYLAAVLEQLRRQAEAKGLAFGIEAAAGLPELRTDPERLRQLLTALVSNAIKFTSRGAVRVEARPVTARERPETLRRSDPAAGEVAAVEIAVRDTGPGIPPEERARIFELFEQLGDPSRTDSLNRGAGLGLTVARQLTRLLRGTLTVADVEEGEGSCFVVRLPVDFSHAVA